VVTHLNSVDSNTDGIEQVLGVDGGEQRQNKSILKCELIANYKRKIPVSCDAST